MPAPFLPDDGSIVFQQLGPADFVNSSEAAMPIGARYLGGRRANCIFGPDGTVFPVFQYATRSWSSDELPPAWGAINTTSVSTAGAELARNTYTSTWNLTTEEADTVSYYEQTKWRFAWRLGPLPSSWRYFHFRWKLAVYDSETDTVTPGDLVDYLWDGELPEGYDEEDSTTWPSTGWTDAVIPDVGADPATEADPSKFKYATRDLVMKWPYTGFFVDEINGTMRGVQGLVPGRFTSQADYLRFRVQPSGFPPYQQ